MHVQFLLQELPVQWNMSIAPSLGWSGSAQTLHLQHMEHLQYLHQVL